MRKRFYDNGIRFACQGDGKCCKNHGQHTFVYVTFGDRKRLAAHLGMTVAEFTRSHTQAADGLVHLKDIDRECPFFRENRCQVHPARPWQCRTWPFWPENMHPQAWERNVAAICPGAGKGRLYTADEIERIVNKQGDAAGCEKTDTGKP